MPCYDKKLESSRADFKVDDLAEVDCVITSVELESMMKENNFNFADFCAQGPADENANPAESFDPFSACSPPRPSPPSGTGASSSGGYQSFVMRYAAKELFDIELTPEAIEEGSAQVKVREISSPDCKEYTLEDSSSGRCLLRFYRVYGFKGMQSVLRAVKKQESAGRLPSVNRMPISRGASGRSRISAFSHDFHFVEIMACPSGCINGAGQLKSEVKSEPLHSSSQALLTKNAEIAYQLIERSRSCLLPERGDALRNLYNRWLHASSDEKSRIREVLHTQYRAVQKSDFLGLKW